ncbi:MAG: hypothetical protein AB7O96_09320 [Pseudobdellovibrionaceae bacterium]
MKYVLLSLFISITGNAAVEVAFIEIRNSKGDVVQLEPDGKFAHMAISYRNLWLHAHPAKGVEIVEREELEKLGPIKFLATIPTPIKLDESEVKKFLGKSYDQQFSWTNEKIYCSELIAKLLKIEPQPMSFESQVWSAKYKKLKGELGLSPDDIFKIFEKRGIKMRPQT